MYTIDDRKCEYMNEKRQKDKTEMKREEQEEKKEEGTLSTRRWMGIVLIIAGMYFGAISITVPFSLFWILPIGYTSKFIMLFSSLIVIFKCSIPPHIM